MCEQIAKIWLILVIASLLLVTLLSLRKPHTMLYWLPLALILGPLALLVWLIAERKPAARAWQAALLQAAGHE